MQQQPSILIIDDHEATLTAMRVLLGRQGYRVSTAAGGREGLEAIRHEAPDLALVDLNMDDVNGLAVLAQLREPGWSMPPCLMMSAENSAPAAVEALQLGAHDFLVKPLDPHRLIARIHDLLGDIHVPLVDTRTAWRDRHAPGIIGEDERLLEVFRVLERIAPTDATVLIQGESGTGKELIARAIHAASRRCNAPFIPVNCAAIPDTLIESELFGHSRGAFSGATRDRNGLFAAADGGTLFLDEIGEMSPAAQAKLLRVLQDGEFARIGETRLRRVDVRIVTATNRDIEVMIAGGRFRSDLYYRLNTIPVRLPSLRERTDDIPRLARHFLQRSAARLGRDEVPHFSDRALEFLRTCPWRGNIRELEHAIEQIVALHGDGDVIGCDTLPSTLLANSTAATPTASGPSGSPYIFELPPEGVDLTELKSQFEIEMIKQALVRADGNKSRAARMLGLNRTTLIEKLRRARKPSPES